MRFVDSKISSSIKEQEVSVTLSSLGLRATLSKIHLVRRILF